MNSSGGKKDTLIRISQFIFRRESEALARDCQFDLIKTALFNAGNTGLDVQDIIQEIDKQMNLKNFPTSIIEGAVETLSSETGQVREESGKYFLENKEYERMNKTIAERKSTLERIESAIKSKIQEEMKEKADSQTFDEALKVLYEFLVTWFSSETSFITNLLFSKKKVAAPDFPRHILNNALEKYDDEILKHAIEHAILETFETLEKEAIKFLYNVLQNYLHLELLNIDPECRVLQKVAFSKKTLVLDTNVLMALFLRAHPLHEGTEQIISISQDIGVNILFTKRTKREWMWSLERADERFKTIRSTRPSLLRQLEDIFIRSYFSEQASNPSLTWQGFYLQMRNVDRLAKARGIEYWYKKDIGQENLPNKEFFDPLSGRVYYCAKIKGNPKSRGVYEHDAYHLLLIRAKREERPQDILGPSCWFLTHDTTLLCADEGLNEFMKRPFDPPSSFIADMWITLITPFLGPEVPEERLAETFVHLMKTTFAVMPSGLDAGKTIEVLGHWLPYRTLSDTDMEKILSDALIDKYYDQLKEAKIKNPRRVEELEKKLREEVDKRVYGIFDKRVADVTKESEEAKKLAYEREQELLAEKGQRKQILTLCAVLGILFALSGLVFLALGNLMTGLALTTSGISFLVLALAFKYIKVKLGPFEMEAKH